MLQVQAFTICSNNYLAQATVLGKSLLQHNPLAKFSIILIDRRSERINYEALQDFELIHIEEIFPDAQRLALKYNIIEFNTAVKPLVFQHFIAKDEKDSIFIYFDPDICIYNKLDPIIESLDTQQIVLTPHILSPIVEDGCYPDDNAVLKFGIYNLGFLGVRKGTETIRMLNWWKNHTFLKGYINLQKGQYTDQLPMGLAPVLFSDVDILKHPGLNMAPWNLHERFLDNGQEEFILTTGEKLVFYHFSDFRPGEPLLLSKNGWYDRFTLEQRRDLHRLYKEYSDDLLQSNYEVYSTVPCFYYPNKKTKENFKGLLIRGLKKMTRMLEKDSSIN